MDDKIDILTSGACFLMSMFEGGLETLKHSISEISCKIARFSVHWRGDGPTNRFLIVSAAICFCSLGSPYTVQIGSMKD